MTTYPNPQEKLERYRREAQKERLLKKRVAHYFSNAALRTLLERLNSLPSTPKVGRQPSL